MAMSNPADRRQQERFYLEFPARFQVGFEKYQRARTLDISVTGARLELEQPVLRGQSIALNLTPEPLRHVSVRGEIVWLGSSWKPGVFEAGVRFESGGRADMVWLEKRLKGTK